MAIIRKTGMTGAIKDVDKREPVGTVGGNVKWFIHLGKLYGVSSKN